MTGRTAAEKILGRASGFPQARAGEIIEASPDLALSHENTFLVHKSFTELGMGRPWDPGRVVIALDHRTPANTVQTAVVHAKIRDVVTKYGINRFFDVGEGVCHQLLVEKRLARPGMLVLGTDSHTTTAGAVGAFATGIGATEMAGVWATGSLWLKVPETVLVTLDGMPGGCVCAKDVSLHLARTLGPSGAEYRCMEFTGSFFHDLTISSRMVLCNMSMEMGAKAALAPVDAVTRMWYGGSELSNPSTFTSDPDANYCSRIRADVSTLSPMVSGPHKVEEVRPVEKAEGIKVNQAFIGTCTNGRLEDLVAAASVLKGHRVAPGCRLLVAPASRQVLEDAIDGGVAQVILSAGGTILPPGCGPCLGSHEGVLAPGEVCISSSNRNFPGRMGSDQAEIYIASPATVAASAVEGCITDPRRFMR